MLSLSSVGHSISLGYSAEYGTTPRKCYEGNDRMHINLRRDIRQVG